jgi:ABC-type amino acid transport substrate-binding protein
MLRGGSVDAFAAPREQLLDYSMKLTGLRVLDDSYGINNVGIAIKKGQSGRFSFISEFVEASKASGLIADIIKRGDLRGFRVAPSL